jgi:hypothetical protein
LKVAVVVPSGDMVHSRFMVSLTSLIQYSQRLGIECVLINPRSSLIATGRNMGVEEARRRKATHILWLDSDMIFPVNLLEALLREGKEVVGCTYVQRKLPTRLLHNELHSVAGVCGEAAKPVEPFVGTGVREVETLPGGVLLVDVKVYDKLVSPVYRCVYQDGIEIGEDVWFCEKVRSLGGSIWLHADLSKQVGHLGTYAHTTGDLDELYR